jgi:hypothetical protein
MSQLSKGNSARISKGIFGALAVSLTFGAIQFASGHDLAGIGNNPAASPDTAVNRVAKADRAAAITGSAIPTKTVSLRFDALSDTSILVRVPVAKEARNIAPAPTAPAPVPAAVKKPSDRKVAVACEPVVSVLTEVAKLLQPGRCVT